MFKRLRGIHSENMALTLSLWLCSLPLVGILVLTFFGLKITAIVALALFLVTMAICWVLCGWQVIKERGSSR